jgi:HlyD family secretion protein
MRPEGSVIRPGERPQHDDASAQRPAGEPRREGVGPQGAALILELQRLRQAFDPETADDGPAPQARRPARDGSRPPAPGRQRPRPPKQKKSKMERAIAVCLEQLGFGAAPPAGRTNSAPPAKRIGSAPAAGRSNTASPAGRINPASQGGRINGAPPSGRRGERPAEPNLKPPPRRRVVTLDNAIPMDLLKPSPELRGSDNRRPSTPINQPRLTSPQSTPMEPMDKPQLALPRPVGNVEPKTTEPKTTEPKTTEPKTTLGQLIEKGRVGVSTGVAFLVNRDGLAHNDNAPGDTLAVRTGRSFERELRVGLRVLLIGLVLGGGWMTLMPLAGAVVVPGNLVVQSNVKTIQHPTGGVVAEIPVRNGMRVAVGDLLLRLDPTQAQASLQVVSKQLDESRARIARLIAERDGLPQPEVPAELAARLNESAVNDLLVSEETQFKARASARYSQKDLLQSRVAQLGEQIGGLDAQVASKAKQLELIAGELTGVQDLYDKRLVPITRLTTLQREAARIEGERGQLISAIAETKAKVGEAQLQIVRIDQDFRTEVVKELGEVQGKEGELVQRGVAARDMLDRIELRAPTSGIVHQLAAHTVGGVIKAGDAIMEVVPDSDDLQVEARLQPNDIDQVRVGQKALIRFSAFNQRTTPQIVGLVSFVSADVSHDQTASAANVSFFTVRMTLPEDELRRLAGLQLVSGMPAEVFMQTGSRTMMSYLMKPITEQLQRAFVER